MNHKKWMILFLVTFAVIPSVMANTLMYLNGTFFDGFESGNFSTNNWTTSGAGNPWSVSNTAPYQGTWHAWVRQTGAGSNSYVETTIVTTAYINITVSYYRQLIGLDPADDYSAAWWNGTGWAVLEQLGGVGTNDATYYYRNFSLPSIASNSSIKLRFMCESGAVSEECRVDNVNVTGIDVVSPGQVTNLDTKSHGATWIYWNWTNPADVDFYQAIIYIDGVWKANTSNNFYNATGLSYNTAYTITVRTKDFAGNVNYAGINSTNWTNKLPTHSNPILNSTNVYNDTYANLTCYPQNTNDADGDSVINIYKWYKNNAIQSSFENYTYISSANTLKGEIWTCEITPTDGYSLGAALNSSITIQNHIPQINFNLSVPASPAENEQVYISAEVYDADGDIVDVYFTVAAPNGTKILNNQSAASHTADFWNSSAFIADSVGTWVWNITAVDGAASSAAAGEFTINSWHIIYGNVSGQLTLKDSIGSALVNWAVNNVTGSNIYIADSDSVIDFSSILALSRDTSQTYTSNDFDNADSILTTETLTDSINNTYVSNGNPKSTSAFTVFGSTINSVPVVNSTDNTKFITGVLWDSSDDIGNDGEYDVADKEDLVFITRVNPSSQGKYGVYDYEIRVPANLRKYHTSTMVSVSIYAEIR